MKENLLEKIHKYAKVGYTLSNVLFTMAIIILVLVLLMTMVFASMPKKMLVEKVVNHNSLVLDLNVIDADINTENKKEVLKEKISIPSLITGREYVINDVELVSNIFTFNGDKEVLYLDYQDYAVGGLVMAIGVMLEIVFLYYVKKICKLMSISDSPFTDSIIDLLKNLSNTLIPLAIYYIISSSILKSIIYGKMLLSSDINFTAIFIIGLLYILITIFRYGAMLQKESDETL